MYIDRDELQNFPFTGTFYRSEIDRSLPLTQQVEQEVVICTVPCDIQEESNMRATATAKAVYGVYVPFDSENETILVQRGHLFRSETYGLNIIGKVIGVFASQLGTFDDLSTELNLLTEHHCRGFLARVEAVDV